MHACARMPRYRYPLGKVQLLFLYENDNFLYQLLSKHTSKCITCCTFSNNFREAYYPISNVQVKSLFLLSQNGNFGEYLKTKSDQNILQNTPNRFIFLDFLVGACLRILSYNIIFFYITKTTFYTPHFIKIYIHHNADHVFNILSGSSNTSYSKRAGKITSFYIKMVIFGIILRNI